ncbi:esterase/PHB depolymerase [Prosthecobacter fusiformis]|uniref:Esterase/PHB depolymerase n=2 Tax=Prosthecobacter fusiformis TaxID=48464 RepID=A0A4R7RZ06_9BACT|nr:esterase/PHB depolymerase [Prosthecobacter fusiformis]
MIEAMRLLAALFLFPILAQAAGSYFTLEYPPSEKPGELIYGVTYILWVPDEVKEIRGVIVHQHGCGAGACKNGETAAYDLHWQALAEKHGCALLGPSFHQEDGDDCRKWCDPRNGSEKAFLRCLEDFAVQSKHPEISQVPWALWGHSGGAFWSSLMLTLHPERIAAIWFRSGSAYYVWEKGDIPRPTLTDAVYQVPFCFNGGLKEEQDKRHGPARVGDRAMFAAWRAKGAPAGFARDPRTGHECGDSRYLAIPFLDACLEMRLPETGVVLKPVDVSQGWLSEMDSEVAVAAGRYEGAKESSAWMPNQELVKARAEYLKTGTVGDTTPPPAATNVTFDKGVLTWDAKADFESGIQQFIILRNGEEIGRVPEKGVAKFGRALFQRMTHGDTPEKPLAEMMFTDPAPAADAKAYQVISVNSVGLRSE